MIADCLDHVRQAALATGLEATAVQAAEARAQTKVVPRVVIHLDAQRSRLVPDGSLIDVRLVAGPPATRVRRYRSHRATHVVAAEVTDKDATAAADRAAHMVRELGVGLLDSDGMWVRVVRAGVEFIEGQAQTTRGRTTTMVLVEFAGGLWRDVVAPLAADVAPVGEMS